MSAAGSACTSCGSEGAPCCVDQSGKPLSSGACGNGLACSGQRCAKSGSDITKRKRLIVAVIIGVAALMVAGLLLFSGGGSKSKTASSSS